MIIALVIPGKPIAKKRPRFARRGKFVTTYNDQETEEGRFLFEVQQQYKGEPLKGAIEVYLGFTLQRPKSHYRTGRNSALLKESAPDHPTGTPDCDNLVKFVFDCLNQCVWVDDAQVFSMMVNKRYADRDETPKTTLFIEQVEAPHD